MQSEGQLLPELVETVVLHRLGLVRSDEIPDLAAGWLATDLNDTESVRMLAGHDKQDPWGIERLLHDAVFEADAVIPNDCASLERIAVGWVTRKWREDRNTRAAVRALAHLGETYPDFDLGLFVGLDDEWNGGWGRLEPDLKTEAKKGDRGSSARSAVT